MKSSWLYLKAKLDVQGVKPSRLLELGVRALWRCTGFVPEGEEYKWPQPGRGPWDVFFRKDPLRIASSCRNKDQQNGRLGVEALATRRRPVGDNLAAVVFIPSEYLGELRGAVDAERIGRKPSRYIALLRWPPPRRMFIMRRSWQSHGVEWSLVANAFPVRRTHLQRYVKGLQIRVKSQKYCCKTIEIWTVRSHFNKFVHQRLRSWLFLSPKTCRSAGRKVYITYRLLSKKVGSLTIVSAANKSAELRLLNKRSTSLAPYDVADRMAKFVRRCCVVMESSISQQCFLIRRFGKGLHTYWFFLLLRWFVKRLLTCTFILLLSRLLHWRKRQFVRMLSFNLKSSLLKERKAPHQNCLTQEMLKDPRFLMLLSQQGNYTTNVGPNRGRTAVEAISALFPLESWLAECQEQQNYLTTSNFCQLHVFCLCRYRGCSKFHMGSSGDKGRMGHHPQALSHGSLVWRYQWTPRCYEFGFQANMQAKGQWMGIQILGLQGLGRRRFAAEWTGICTVAEEDASNRKAHSLLPSGCNANLGRLWPVARQAWCLMPWSSLPHGLEDLWKSRTHSQCWNGLSFVSRLLVSAICNVSKNKLRRYLVNASRKEVKLEYIILNNSE